MTELSGTILRDYQVRKTRTQKQRFAAFLQSHFPSMQIEESGFPRCRNLVVGDVEHAKVIFTAHYDTCAQLPFPNLIMPKNILGTILYSLLIVIPFFLVGGVVFALLQNWTADPVLSYWVALVVFLALFFGLFYAGKPNRHTANDNTSGVIVLCELLQQMSKQELAQAAFVFFDHEENGLLGSSQFRKRHKNSVKNQLVVNFDCVSDGDHLLFVQNGAARKRYGAVLRGAFGESADKQLVYTRSANTFYPSDQSNFPCNVGVTAMHKGVFGYYLARIHTSRDTMFDEENIRLLCAGAQRLMKNI